jgi:sigma-B regulation protein RsbU (phosphoserine phosphatase)
MAYAHSHIVGIVRNESNPARIVKALNEVASYDNVSCTFLTLLVGVLDLPTGRLQYCNAAHTPPFILGDDVKELACDPNQPVGPLGGVEFSLQEITLTPGSTLFLYTDGLTEAKNAQGQEFGCERTKNALIDCRERQLNPKDIVNTVTEAVHQFTKNAEQSDDLTMLVVRYT